MNGQNVLSLLGLALRGGRLSVGEEPAALAAKAGQARLLLTAADAAGNTLRRAEHLAEEGHCLHLTLPFSKAELGGALGRGSAAIAALTDLGLAAAAAERLALLDPERYGDAAARMDLKRRRAKERKEAPRRDPPRRDPPPENRERRSGRPRREQGRPPRDRRRPEERRAEERKRAGTARPPAAGRERPETASRPGRRGPAKGRGSKPPAGRDKGGGR